MFRRTASLALGRPLVLLAVALAAGAACADDGGESGEVGGRLADRWVRLGEDLSANVQVYEGEVPPGFRALLNPDATAETPEEDRVALPVHPGGELLGSFQIRRPQGTTLVWLVFDVAADEQAVAEQVGRQLNETPWQVTGGQSSESLSAIRFRSTVSDGIDGTAVVQPLPATDSYDLTVQREGDEVVLRVPRGAPAPQLEAELSEEGDSVLVGQVTGGAREAGLQEDDRLVAVAGKPVKTIKDLDRALRELADDGTPRSTVVYILEVQALSAVREPSFVPPQSHALPPNFPAAFLVPDDMTVAEVGWQTEGGATAYQLAMFSEQSTTDVAEQLRQALETEGWEIVDDSASGFATVLQFASSDGQVQGAVSIDAFSLDSAYTAVQLQLQSGPSPGN